MSDQKTTIVASNVANPLPDIFPHAVKAAGLVFVSGSIALDENNKMVEGGIKEHTVYQSPTLLNYDVWTDCVQLASNH